MFEKIISKPHAEEPEAAELPVPPRPAGPPAAAPAPPPPASPRNAQATTSGQRNVLLPDVEINGKVSFENDLIVDGKIEGEIVSDGSLTIGENAKIKAEIHTRSVIVYGKVHGNITVTERVEIRKDAELIGDVKAAVLVMEAGAVFVGNSTVGAPASVSAPASAKAPASGNAPAPGKAPAPAKAPVPAKKPQPGGKNPSGPGPLATTS